MTKQDETAWSFKDKPGAINLNPSLMNLTLWDCIYLMLLAVNGLSVAFGRQKATLSELLENAALTADRILESRQLHWDQKCSEQSSPTST